MKGTILFMDFIFSYFFSSGQKLYLEKVEKFPYLTSYLSHLKSTVDRFIKIEITQS